MISRFTINLQEDDMAWHKDRHIDLRSIKSAAIDPHAVCLLIFDKGIKAVQGSKENLFNRWCWNTG